MAIPSTADSAALARGGRTNFLGFLLRLMARLPFLVIAGRLYGAESLGRFAYATMVVELAAALAVVGLRRGLAAELARREGPETHVIADALLLSLLLAMLAAVCLISFPLLLFPDGVRYAFEPFFALIILAIALSDVALAALAFRHRIDAQVRARSLIEPWVLTLSAVALAFTPVAGSGLLLAYLLSLVAAFAASLIPAARLFGMPQGWAPSPSRMLAIIRRNLPLAGADVIEWGTRRVDIFILGRFAPPETVGIYFVAQQVATLAGKVRSSFDPILAPMLASALVSGERALAAAHLRQVGFWVIAFQLPIILALGLPGEGILGLFGPAFAVGGVILALLLVAELAAASASLSEMALIYARPRLNLVISAIGIGFQAALCLLLVPRFGGEGAAVGLLASILLVAMVKQLVLRHDLGASVTLWRWSLLLAAIPTFLFGFVARQLPELPQMLVTIPGSLLLFAVLIWRFGFSPTDRMLFQRGEK